MNTKQVKAEEVQPGDTIHGRGKVLATELAPMHAGIVTTIRDNAGDFKILWEHHAPVILDI
jgi:hypothetical protein